VGSKAAKKKKKKKPKSNTHTSETVGSSKKIPNQSSWRRNKSEGLNGCDVVEAALNKSEAGVLEAEGSEQICSWLNR
jgi:hypothetical protein